MRRDPSIAIKGNSDVFYLPLNYKFEQTVHGVTKLAFSNVADLCPFDQCINRCALKYRGDALEGDGLDCSKGCAGVDSSNPATVTDKNKFCSNGYNYCKNSCDNDSSLDDSSKKNRCHFGCELWNTQVRRSDDTTVCMVFDSDGKVTGAECQDNDSNSVLSYDSSSHRIQSEDVKCIDYNFSSSVIEDTLYFNDW